MSLKRKGQFLACGRRCAYHYDGTHYRIWTLDEDMIKAKGETMDEALDMLEGKIECFNCDE